MTTAPLYILHPVTLARPDGTCATYRVLVRADPRSRARVDPADRRRAVAALLARAVGLVGRGRDSGGGRVVALPRKRAAPVCR